MSTLREQYCIARQCRPQDFETQLFWQSLHRHALPAALFSREGFAADRELIANAGAARNLRELNEEIRDFMDDSRNLTWWRGRAHMRISTHRLRSIARRYLPAAQPLSLDSSRRRVA